LGRQLLSPSTDVVSDAIPDTAPAMKRFKFLASKLQQSNLTRRTGVAADSIQGQLSQYLAEMQSSPVVTDNALQFWRQQQTSTKLAAIAEDLISAPASQAYVERIFSLCGFLTAGRRNAMKKSLAMRACLKLNNKVLRDSGF
jgi:hAT family C-terminal dimerisation region